MPAILFALVIFTIDSRYHTFNEVAYELDSVANHYSNVTLLDTLGYSTRDSLPIFAMKISDNVRNREDEPAILYVACHHAEEILGIEICMYMIHDLLTNYTVDSTITHWIDNREIWIVPLLNPEGHAVVMEGIDTIWRKNKRDNNNNGFFDLDYDGVDPNRNYDFHWSEGGSSEPSSEYYRGYAPFSENETKALRDLCLSQNFLFCNTYHSARTGLGEVIYYPWRWGGGFPPDHSFIRAIADTMSKLIMNDEGNGHYTALVGTGLDGRARNWLYGVCGIFAYTVEVSTTCIQPGWMVDDICERNLAGAYYLLDRVDGSGITGRICDSLTGAPVSAEVIISGCYDANLPPRKSEPMFGRFFRILSEGFYDIEIRKRGYKSKYYHNVEVKNGRLTKLNVYLKNMDGLMSAEKNANQMFIYPNPTRDAVVIRLSNPSDFSSLRIYNTAGRLVKSIDSPPAVYVWQGTDTLERKSVTGIYWLVGEMNQEIVVKKMIVLN